MSYTGFFEIEPKQSMQLLVVLFFAHLISALVALILLPNHWIVQFVVLLLIGFSWFYYYRLHITKVLSRSVFSAYHHQDRGWSVSIAPEYSSNVQNDDMAVTLSSSSYMSRWWVVLNFNPIDNLAAIHRRYTLLVPVDSVSAEVYRHLRVRLKIM